MGFIMLPEMCVAYGLSNFKICIPFHIPIFIKTVYRQAVVNLPGEARTPQFGRVPCRMTLLEWAL